MTEEPPGRTEGPGVPDDDEATARSAELVVLQRRPPVAAPGRLRHLVARLRGRLPEVRRHPVMVASASAAATVGSALLANGLRHALGRPAAARPVATGAGTGTAVVVGYIVHEVHVIHHLVQDARHPGASPRPLTRG